MLIKNPFHGGDINILRSYTFCRNIHNHPTDPYLYCFKESKAKDNFLVPKCVKPHVDEIYIFWHNKSLLMCSSLEKAHFTCMLQFLQFANIVFQLTKTQGEKYQGSTSKGLYHSNFYAQCSQDFVCKLSVLFFSGGFSTWFILNFFMATVHLKLSKLVLDR